jgi:anti-sigma regulatory factor (Ser/Thr protein kinase)
VAERRVALSQVRVTGRTLRIVGTLDLNAAGLYFSIPEADRRRIEWVNFQDTWRIHPSGLLPVLADLLENHQAVRLRVDGNYWVERFLEIYGYDQFLRNGNVDPDSLPIKGARHYPEDGEGAHDYVRKLLHEALARQRCGRDIAESIEWATSELIGNVFHHGESPLGVLAHFVIQPTMRRAIFTLVDTGMGILKSLSQAYPDLRTDAQAIELALQRGVTSKRENQGWGLFGSAAIIEATQGKLQVWSGRSIVVVRAGSRLDFPMPSFNGTVIEWVLPMRRDINLASILENPNRAQSFQLERYEPTPGTVNMRLAGEASTFADRPTGRKLRNKLINLIENAQAKRCVVDFDGIGVITSSFADEFLGKTAFFYGSKFKTFVSVANASDINRAILEIAIRNRLESEANASVPMRITTRE